MQGSGYYRTRAHMCLRIADLISDSESAKKLRADAAHYLSWADEIDARNALGRADDNAVAVADAAEGIANDPPGPATPAAI